MRFCRGLRIDVSAYLVRRSTRNNNLRRRNGRPSSNPSVGDSLKSERMADFGTMAGNPILPHRV